MRKDEFAEVPRMIVEHGMLIKEAQCSSDWTPDVLHDRQRHLYNLIMNAAEANLSSLNITNNIYFVEGSGGNGKTYIFSTILDSFRRNVNIVLAVASRGTAALLLKGGRTAHSRVKNTASCTAEVDMYDLTQI